MEHGEVQHDAVFRELCLKGILGVFERVLVLELELELQQEQ
jgi:hypothetical protein